MPRRGKPTTRSGILCVKHDHAGTTGHVFAGSSLRMDFQGEDNASTIRVNAISSSAFASCRASITGTAKRVRLE